jgi:hypothetical protein
MIRNPRFHHGRDADGTVHFAWGISVLALPELESVRRQRKAAEAQEHGVKGMRWGHGGRSKQLGQRHRGYVSVGIDPWSGETKWVPKGGVRSKAERDAQRKRDPRV